MLAYATVFLLAFILLVALYSFHKIRQIHLGTFIDRKTANQLSSKLFRQIEALQSLYVDLELEKSLPPTRDWAGSPDFLLELAQYALSKKPQTVVECSSGTSTVVLARCMQLNGNGIVYSLEHDPDFAEKTRAHLERHGLSQWAMVLDAPIRSHQIRGDIWPWYAMERLPQTIKIDMLAIDGPPAGIRSLARYPAGPLLFPLLASNAVVFLDDASRDDEKEILKQWNREFPTLDLSLKSCEKGCAFLQRRSDCLAGLV